MAVNLFVDSIYSLTLVNIFAQTFGSILHHDCEINHVPAACFHVSFTFLLFYTPPPPYLPSRLLPPPTYLHALSHHFYSFDQNSNALKPNKIEKSNEVSNCVCLFTFQEFIFSIYLFLFHFYKAHCAITQRVNTKNMQFSSIISLEYMWPIVHNGAMGIRLVARKIWGKNAHIVTIEHELKR